jgi:hypothetical protein
MVPTGSLVYFTVPTTYRSLCHSTLARVEAQDFVISKHEVSTRDWLNSSAHGTGESRIRLRITVPILTSAKTTPVGQNKIFSLQWHPLAHKLSVSPRKPPPHEQLFTTSPTKYFFNCTKSMTKRLDDLTATTSVMDDVSDQHRDESQEFTLLSAITIRRE